MNENVDIYICTHKSFDSVVSNDVYKVIDSRDIRSSFKIANVLDDIDLSEFYVYRYIFENYKLKDYIGFCHYRRYYAFLDDVPNMDEVFKTYDVITRSPIMLSQTVYEQYKSCHNIEDLDLLGQIINEEFHEYYDTYKTFIKGKILIPCNMFIMKSNDFVEYSIFIKNVMKEYFWRFGIDTVKKINDNKDKYIKTFYPNNTIEYQRRIFAFVFERLTNVFIFNKFKKIKTYNVLVTENKYNLKNNSI